MALAYARKDARTCIPYQSFRVPIFPHCMNPAVVRSTLADRNHSYLWTSCNAEGARSGSSSVGFGRFIETLGHAHFT